MKQDKVIGPILLAFAAFMYYQATKLPPALFGDVGAGYVPKIWFSILGICGVALTVTGFLAGRKHRASEADTTTDANARQALKQFFIHYRFVISGFAIFFFYVLLMKYIGYLYSTLIFMPVFMWVLGPKTRKSIAVIALTTMGVTGIIYWGFVKVLKVFLPSGSLF
ncbi:MAG: tripartite tricarboxylate transporter TctB family protein [Deltaproteobacteria bacterium]|nr:tripartite tricarboxylate transporter TctB family protein [Deltaproteobacteria bacterium]MBW2153143.1 tripartite tricarboxylate transporter TctB family protein [Deltaproteobacteria bacterium]